MKKRNTLAAGLLAVSMTALMLGAVSTAVQDVEIVEAAETESGTLGDNNNIKWTYDVNTKTLTVTGEDEIIDGGSLSAAVSDIRSEVEYVKVKNLKLSGSARMMFYCFTALKSIEFDNFDTQNVTNMEGMFYECINLSSLDVSNFNTENVTNMSYMFSGCSELNSLNVSNFNTKKVTNMSNMFSECSNLSSLDLSSFEIIENTSCVRFFYGDYSSLNTIYAPSVIAVGCSIDLPHIFYDEQKNEVTTITSEHCGQSLSIHNISTDWSSDDNSHWYSCTHCDSKFEESNHIEGTGATCMKQAVCEVCGKSYGTTNSVHGNTEIRNKAAATCTSEGYTGDTYCKDCEEMIASGTKIPMSAHDYDSKWNSNEAEHWYECTVCGAKKEQASHKAGTSATCTKKATCEVCGKSYGATNNVHGNTEVRNKAAATCTATGYTGDTYCKDCNQKIKSGTSTAMLAHTYDSKWTTNETDHWQACAVCGAKKEQASHKAGTSATCTKKATCEVCGKSYGATNNVHGNTEVRNKAAATCTATGYTGDTYCKDCNQKTESGKVISATGHDYTSKVTTEPTTEKEGVETYTCKNCNDSYTKAIAKLPKPEEPAEPSEPEQSTEPSEPEESAKPEGKPSDNENWKEEEGQNYWYEEGVKQGTEGRGKEIYDPDSDAWYWLDSVQDGAIAKNKDVYQESLAGAWGDYIGEDGERYGKWVRYDENGHMVKGWQTNADGTYFFDYTYGTMAKGYATIDGKEYYFNKDTGILECEFGEVPEMGWKNIDGIDYWYEGHVRQGYSVDSSFRGKEIYDADSDAWYWLDNVDGGKKAVSKDVYQESLAGEWGDYIGADGERYGKWVRYDENGHMIKGWSTNENGTYYFDLVYGTMAKGDAVIDGQNYYFDVNTGILQ